MKVLMKVEGFELPVSQFAQIRYPSDFLQWFLEYLHLTNIAAAFLDWHADRAFPPEERS